MYLHENQHLVHRDLKPQNIFLTTESMVKIGDFGLARPNNLKLDKKDQLFTPVYASPEQFSKASTLDTQSDIYSLGVVLLELNFNIITNMELIQTIKSYKSTDI